MTTAGLKFVLLKLFLYSQVDDGKEEEDATKEEKEDTANIVICDGSCILLTSLMEV